MTPKLTERGYWAAVFLIYGIGAELHYHTNNSHTSIARWQIVICIAVGLWNILFVPLFNFMIEQSKKDNDHDWPRKSGDSH